MKKRILALMLLVAATGMVSCGDGNNNPPDPDPDPVTADVTYEINGGSDMIDLFALTAVYMNAAGVETREAITALPWSKVITNVGLPFSLKVAVECTKKTGFAEKDSYTCGLNAGYAYVLSNGVAKSQIVISTTAVPKNKIGEYQEQVLARTFEATARIEAP